MKHAHVDEYYTAYLEGSLPEPLRQEVEAHLRGCPRCVDELAALRRLVAELRRLPEELPAVDMAARVRARLTPRPCPIRWHWLVLAGGVAAVMLVLCCCLLRLAPAGRAPLTLASAPNTRRAERASALPGGGKTATGSSGQTRYTVIAALPPSARAPVTARPAANSQAISTVMAGVPTAAEGARHPDRTAHSAMPAPQTGAQRIHAAAQIAARPPATAGGSFSTSTLATSYAANAATQQKMMSAGVHAKANTPAPANYSRFTSNSPIASAQSVPAGAAASSAPVTATGLPARAVVAQSEAAPAPSAPAMANRPNAPLTLSAQLPSVPAPPVTPTPPAVDEYKLSATAMKPASPHGAPGTEQGMRSTATNVTVSDTLTAHSVSGTRFGFAQPAPVSALNSTPAKISGTKMITLNGTVAPAPALGKAAVRLAPEHAGALPVSQRLPFGTVELWAPTPPVAAVDWNGEVFAMNSDGQTLRNNDSLSTTADWQNSLAPAAPSAPVMEDIQLTVSGTASVQLTVNGTQPVQPTLPDAGVKEQRLALSVTSRTFHVAVPHVPPGTALRLLFHSGHTSATLYLFVPGSAPHPAFTSLAVHAQQAALPLQQLANETGLYLLCPDALATSTITFTTTHTAPLAALTDLLRRQHYQLTLAGTVGNLTPAE